MKYLDSLYLTLSLSEGVGRRPLSIPTLKKLGGVLYCYIGTLVRAVVFDY